MNIEQIDAEITRLQELRRQIEADELSVKLKEYFSKMSKDDVVASLSQAITNPSIIKDELRRKELSTGQNDEPIV